jgi:hypothetical protein
MAIFPYASQGVGYPHVFISLGGRLIIAANGFAQSLDQALSRSRLPLPWAIGSSLKSIQSEAGGGLLLLDRPSGRKRSGRRARLKSRILR